MTELDVIVAGGGPAGAVHAMLVARRGRSVALVCGRAPQRRRAETISAVAASMLHGLGLAECLPGCGGMRSSGVVDVYRRTVANGGPAVASPHGTAWHVDRARFDASLQRAAAAAGARLVHDDVTGVERSGDAFVVRCTRGDLLISAVLVDATGTRAAVARRLGSAPIVLDRQLAIFAEVVAESTDRRLVVAPREQGWLYITPRGDGRVQVALVTDAISLHGRRPAAALHDALLEHPRVLDCERPSSVWTTTATIQATPPLEGVALIGDAAWSCDALSGHGVAEAIASATTAALDGELSAPVPTALSHLRRRTEVVAAAWPESSHWRRRAMEGVVAWR